MLLDASRWPSSHASASSGPGRLTSTQVTALLEALPDALVMVIQTGHIALLNRQAEVLFGSSREELLGQPLESLLPERFRGVHVLHREQ